MTSLRAITLGLLVFCIGGGEALANDTSAAPSPEPAAKKKPGKPAKPSLARLKKNSENLGKLHWALGVLSRQKPRAKLTDEQKAEFKQAMAWYRAQAKRAAELKVKTDKVVEKTKKNEQQSALADEDLVLAREAISVDSMYSNYLLDLLKLQEMQNRLTQQMTMMSNMAARAHQTAMSIINNMR